MGNTERDDVFSQSLTSIGSLVCCFLFFLIFYTVSRFFFSFLKKPNFPSLSNLKQSGAIWVIVLCDQSAPVITFSYLWKCELNHFYNTHTHTHVSSWEIISSGGREEKSDWLLKDQFAEEKGSVDSKTISCTQANIENGLLIGHTLTHTLTPGFRPWEMAAVDY